LTTFLELAAERVQKVRNNSTSPEKLFKGWYQSIFSKKDNTFAAAKMTTQSESKWNIFKLDKDVQATVVLPT